MFERKVWTIFHVFLIYSIECPLHLWFQMCKMFKKIWICDKQSGNKWNFHHLFQRTLCTCFSFLVFKPTIVKHCIQFFVWELIISLLLDQKLKAASFSFGTSECWIGIQAVSKVERKQDSGLFLLQCWKGDCLINCLQIFASGGKNWQKTWSSAAQNITTPDTTQQ